MMTKLFSLALAVLTGIPFGVCAADPPKDGPDWATTMKYLTSYFPSAGYTIVSKDGDVIDSYTAYPAKETPGTFTYLSTLQIDTRLNAATVVTTYKWGEIELDLKKLDPALFKITQEKVGEMKLYQLTLAGPKGCDAVTAVELRESAILKGRPDTSKRDTPRKFDSVTIYFKDEDTAKAASKAFRRAAILSGAKETERDPFKD